MLSAKSCYCAARFYPRRLNPIQRLPQRLGRVLSRIQRLLGRLRIPLHNLPQLMLPNPRMINIRRRVHA